MFSYTYENLLLCFYYKKRYDFEFFLTSVCAIYFRTYTICTKKRILLYIYFLKEERNRQYYMLCNLLKKVFLKNICIHWHIISIKMIVYSYAFMSLCLDTYFGENSLRMTFFNRKEQIKIVLCILNNRCFEKSSTLVKQINARTFLFDQVGVQQYSIFPLVQSVQQGQLTTRKVCQFYKGEQTQYYIILKIWYAFLQQLQSIVVTIAIKC
eukprot:TRINITY_DN2844_c0_g1_i2.p6 TRINITY_DN2844_c0_g1~~TRINITY_DN2844_c0_g1_i2.p6  ORF type:complete len:210 (-),score=-14.25 TRINITY_DN2844_c0_g1_i2:2093-2722(-)